MAVLISPQQALERIRSGARFLDIRSEGERASGMAESAVGVSLDDLLDSPPRVLQTEDKSLSLVLICAKGIRSRHAANALNTAGYSSVFSVEGGTEHWAKSGLPMSAPSADADFFDRYSRQLLLPNVGFQGQKKLENAHVLLVGAGGLGSPIALYLAAAGVGHITLCDDDVVDLSNLQRQVLHQEATIGTAKVLSAQSALNKLNHRVRITPVAERLNSGNIDALMANVDVVIDGADNFPVRYLVSDACIKHKKPMVYGAVQRFSGQVGVFDAGRQRGSAPCYRCLFPEPPNAEDAPNCAEAGVLGVLPGLIGLIQATETLKLLLGIGAPLIGRLLTVDALSMQFRDTKISADPECPVCAAGVSFPGYIDYAEFCSAT